MNGRGVPRVLVAPVAAVLVAVLVAVPAPPAPVRAEVVPEPCGSELSVAAILAIPEEKRAGCFGRASLTFDAWAGPRITAWQLDVPAGLGEPWEVREALDRAGFLALRPAGVGHPEDLPAAGDTGIEDPYWTLTGHFADPLADDCRAVPELEGSPTDDDAQAWCRNQFVLEALVLRPEGPGWRPAPDATPAAPLPTAAPADPAAVTGGAPGLLILVGTLVAGLAIIGAAAVAGTRVRRRDGRGPVP